MIIVELFQSSFDVCLISLSNEMLVDGDFPFPLPCPFYYNTFSWHADLEMQVCIPPLCIWLQWWLIENLDKFEQLFNEFLFFF
jgi:hypothetical protein